MCSQIGFLFFFAVFGRSQTPQFGSDARRERVRGEHQANGGNRRAAMVYDLQ